METIFFSSCFLECAPIMKKLPSKRLDLELIQYAFEQNSLVLCFHYIGLFFTPTAWNDFCFQLARSIAYVY